MRDLSILAFVTIDGVAQGPTQPDEDTSGGFAHSGWMANYFEDVMELVNAELMETPISFLFGRKTYEMFMPHWSAAPQSPHADLLNCASKYVATSSLDKAGWANSELIKGDVIAELKRIKAGDGPRLQVHGSIELIQTLLAHDLVDEFRLLTFPVVLGTGRRLFGDKAKRVDLKLIRSKVSEMGVVMAVYRRR